MSEKNLIVCDKEILFAVELGENISSRSEYALKVYTYTSVENVLKFQKRKKIHILIVDERFVFDERKQIGAEQVFVLTKDCCRDLQKGEKQIYKFQSADKILAEVFKSYYENTNDSLLKSVRKEKGRLIAVYSPIHRIGKTTFALALGKELARKEKTLYLNFEEYADIGGRFQQAEGRNFGDLLYFLRQEEGNLPFRLSNMIEKKEELDYVSPIPSCIDLKEISEKDWKLLFESLLKESIYETIILDLSESVQGLFAILQMCDQIYMPVLEDAISVNKICRYEENIEKFQLKGIMEKTYRFVVTEDMGQYGIEDYARKLAKEE